VAALYQKKPLMPTVSVIVPNFNHARYLQQRLDSILQQTFQDFELIILDDCSTDDSRAVIERYSSHPKVSHIVFNEVNAGTPFKQWEKGLALATGEWVWIAESDDFASPLFLETLVTLASDKPGLGIAYCGSHWVDESGMPGKDLSSYQTSFHRAGTREVSEKLWYVCTIQNASSAIIRKDLALRAIQGLTDYRACGDWIFYVKLLQQADILFSEKKLNSFRYYHSNTSNWAEKKGLWVTEGVDLLKHLDFRKLKTSRDELLHMLRFWKDRAKTIRIRQRPMVWLTIATTYFRYWLSGAGSGA